MRGIVALVACFVLLSPTMAQDSVIVAVEVMDARYKDPIQNVRVTVDYDSASSIRSTNTRGLLYFKTPTGIRLDFGLTHPRFNSENSIFKIPKKNNPDTVVVALTMDAVKVRSLDEVVISAPGVPLTVFGSERLHPGFRRCGLSGQPAPHAYRAIRRRPLRGATR